MCRRRCPTGRTLDGVTKLLVALALITAVAPAAADDETPPLHVGRLAGEVLLGGVFGAAGGLVGAYAGARIERAGGCENDRESCGVTGGILGGTAAITLLMPVGVYLAGNYG